MLKRLFILSLIILTPWFSTFGSRPKLVVVISLDQFRYDYLTRFQDYFGSGGFRMLMDNGANFSNASYKHSANMTGPGHAVILTGTYGNQNGIITNNWYDRTKQQNVYCVADPGAQLVGASGEGRSPANLITPTFGDELRLHTGFKSKVISIAHKDRAAILMGGKMPNDVFWLIDSTFVTSSYYMNALPLWVQSFNESGQANSYFGKRWERLLPDEAFAAIDDDNVPYESDWSSIGRTFPHPIRGSDSTRITKSYYSAFMTSPFSMEALATLAKAAIEGEHLGQGEFPDLLCIGFSSTDYVGHTFGPHSREVIEMAVQTDKILADFLLYLDEHVGLRNTIVVLTSDHGVAPIPEYIRSRFLGADVNRLSGKKLLDFCNSSLANVFGSTIEGKPWIKRMVDGNVYLDRDLLREKKLDPENVAAVLADSLMSVHELALAVTHQALRTSTLATPLHAKMQRSFHPMRSGDVMFVLKPFMYLDDSAEGAEHGSPYEHDAHVPLIIMGNGVRSGTYATEAGPADIGPTLSTLLGVEFPAAREGRVLVEALTPP